MVYRCFKHRKYNAFTLAEMLIALVIVGIASAMLVPRLLNTMGDGQQNAKISESVSLIKQLLTTAQSDATGQNWAAYMETQLASQFGVVSGFSIPTGNGCAGTAQNGYTAASGGYDSTLLLKDGTIIRILSNAVVGTQAGEIDVCIDPTGGVYESPLPSGSTKGKAKSFGYAARVDVSAPTLRLNLKPTLTAGALPGLAVTTGATRLTVDSLGLF